MTSYEDLLVRTCSLKLINSECGFCNSSSPAFKMKRQEIAYYFHLCAEALRLQESRGLRSTLN
jgi:hypothetical protein